MSEEDIAAKRQEQVKYSPAKDPRFYRLMSLFAKYGLPVVPVDEVDVGPPQVMPNLCFWVNGPREATISYDISGFDSVTTWFGHSHHDSGGMFLSASLIMGDEPRPPKPIYIATEADVKRAAFEDILNRARAYPRPPPTPPKPVPNWVVERRLHDILRLHKRYMQSGRQRVLANFQRSR